MNYRSMNEENEQDRTRKLTNIETEIYFDYNSLICASGNTLYVHTGRTDDHIVHTRTRTRPHLYTHAHGKSEAPEESAVHVMEFSG